MLGEHVLLEHVPLFKGGASKMTSIVNSKTEEVLAVIHDARKKGAIDEDSLWQELHRKAVEISSSQESRGELLAMDVLTNALTRLGIEVIRKSNGGDK